jgi:hypothetical protein
MGNMEKLEDLINRIEAYKSADSIEKFAFAIEPVISIGIRDFLSRAVKDHVVGITTDLDRTVLIKLLSEVDHVDENTVNRAILLNKAVRLAMRKETLRVLSNKYDGQFSEMLKESEQVMENDDFYLDEAHKFLITLLSMVQEN